RCPEARREVLDPAVDRAPIRPHPAPRPSLRHVAVARPIAHLPAYHEGANVIRDAATAGGAPPTPAAGARPPGPSCYLAPAPDAPHRQPPSVVRRPRVLRAAAATPSRRPWPTVLRGDAAATGPRAAASPTAPQPRAAQAEGLAVP